MRYLLTKIRIIIRNVFKKHKTTDTWSRPFRHCVILSNYRKLLNLKLMVDLYVFIGHFCKPLFYSADRERKLQKPRILL